MKNKITYALRFNKSLQSLKFNFKLTILTLFLLAGFTISSCKKDVLEKEVKSIEKDEILYNRFLQAGYKASDIKDLGKGYILQGDLYFDKFNTDLDYFDKYFGLTDNKAKKKINSNTSILQWQTPNIISTENVETIIGIHVAYGGVAYNALSNWANIPDSKINFYTFGYSNNNNNSIDFIYTNQNVYSDLNGYYALAEFPTNSRPGYRIRINQAVFNPLTYDKQLQVLTHEIGHCLGLRHTNWQGLGEGSYGTTLIPGTPSTDASSVMTIVNPLPSFSVMPYYDQVAVQTLYPFQSYDKLITSPEGKMAPRIILYNDDHVNITWNTSLLSSPSTTLKIELYQDNIYKGVVATGVPNSGSFNGDSIMTMLGGGSFFYGLQVRITDESDLSITDINSMFYIKID